MSGPGRAGDGRVTVWVLGDQLDRRLGALGRHTPATARVLVVESTAKLTSKRWHLQRAHLVLTAMRRFVVELRAEGFEVDHRRAASLSAGLAEHRADHPGVRVVATEPASWDGRALLERRGVELMRTDQFLCHPDEFAAWAAGRKRLRMEDFSRWQRQRLGYLMVGDQPVGGRWNYDDQNREPPPKDGRAWPEVLRSDLDEVDREVLADLAALGAPARGAPRRMGRGPRRGTRPCAVWSTRWPRCCPASAPTRTPCSPTAGRWPTRS